MLDSFFYAAKPRLLIEPRPMQTLHSSHPSLGAASRLSLLSLGRCTQQVSLHTCLSLAPSAKFSTCKLCSRPGMLAAGRRKRLPSAQPSLPPLSLLSLGRFAPSAQEICAKNQPSSQATPSLIFYLISNMQTLRIAPPVARLSLLSLGCCTCDGPKVQSPFAPSAQETFTRIGLTLRVKTFTRLVSTKRKGRENYRRSRNLHATCCILQHLQQSCCRTLRLVQLKRKGRLTEIDGIKICVEKILWSPPYFSLAFELQEFTRFFFLLDFMKKKRTSKRDRRPEICVSHRHLLRSLVVVAGSSSLTRYEDAVLHLISYALKRKEKERSLSKESRKQRTPKPALRLRQRCRTLDRSVVAGSSLTPRSLPSLSSTCLALVMRSLPHEKCATTLFPRWLRSVSFRWRSTRPWFIQVLRFGYGFFPCLRWGFGPSVWFCCCGSLRRCRPSGFPGFFVRGGRFGWRFRCGFNSSGCCKEHGL